MSTHRAVRIFNSFFSGFLRDLKEIDDRFRKAVKNSYSVIDKSSEKYCEYFKDHVYTQLPCIVAEEFEDEKLLMQNVCQGICMSDVMLCCADNDEQKKMIINYLLILTLFAYLSCEDDDQHADVDIIKQAVELLGLIQQEDYKEFDARIENVLDDCMVNILNVIRKYGGKTRVQSDKIAEAAEPFEVDPMKSTDTTGAQDAFDPVGLFDKISNSKIADLAKEISKDIDVSSLKSDNPDEVLKNLFSGNGETNVLGDIISKVSSTLNNKISKGELKHEDLLSEAMSMMNLFGNNKGGTNQANSSNPMDILGNLANNPLFSQFTKAMKGGKAAVRQDVVRKASARDRLRKKLEEKKAAAANAQ